MNRRPEIRAQIATLDSAVGGGFDGKTKVCRTRFDARNVFMESGVGLPVEPTLQLGDGKGEEMTNIGHTLKIMPKIDMVKSNDPYSFFGYTHHIGGMDIWPLRKTFKKNISLYQKKTGKTQEQVALELGITVVHLRNCLYRKDKRMGIDVLGRAATLFGCDITEFVDNPNAELPGIDPGEMSHMTPAKRLILRSVAQKLSPDDVTDEQAEKVWRALDALVEAGKIRSPK